jgi:hypothetical protein
MLNAVKHLYRIKLFNKAIEMLHCAQHDAFFIFLTL